jgi:hypothetical protein
MRFIIPLLAVAGTLGACAGPEVVNSTPPGITLRVDRSNTAEANARADRYCQQYGKRARLQNVQPTSTTESVAQYQCG